MCRSLFCPISILLVGLALSLKAAPTPTPTPTPKKSFFSALKPRANPSATVARTGAAVGRGSHLGIDRSAQTPTPKPTAKPKSKSSPVAARRSLSPSATLSKPVKPPTPGITATPSATPSPQKEISPEEELPPITSTHAESVSTTPTPMPSSTATTTPKPIATTTVTATPTPTASISPFARPTKIELTLTKFEPPHGSHGDRDYRSAQLSYRIDVPNRMEYPTINFTVETPSGKLFERVARLPAGSTFV